MQVWCRQSEQGARARGWNKGRAREEMMASEQQQKNKNFMSPVFEV